MKTSTPKLHSVRLKAGGAKVKVYKNPNSPEYLTREFLAETKDIAVNRRADMVGYAVVAWCNKGGCSAAMRVCDGRWLGRFEAPEFVKSVLDDLINRED